MIANQNSNLLVEATEATQTTKATFQINNAKLYMPVVTLSINGNIKFLENIKQGFKRTISWNKCRSEVTTPPKNNNLDYMIDPTFRNINRFFAFLFKNGNDDPTRNSFDKSYMPLREIKDFYAFINNTGQQNFMTKMLLGNGHMFLGYFFKLILNLETIFLYQV